MDLNFIMLAVAIVLALIAAVTYIWGAAENIRPLKGLSFVYSWAAILICVVGMTGAYGPWPHQPETRQLTCVEQVDGPWICE